MERRIQKLLREMVEKKSNTLNEGIQIFKSKEIIDRSQGPGYYIYLSSNNPDGAAYKKETLDMAKELNITRDALKAKKWRKDFIPPSWVKIDDETGQFGWGYLITSKRPADYAQKSLEYLKILKRDYDMKNKLEDDVQSGDLTLKQVGEIQKLTSAMEETLAKEMNPETKAKLEKYLDDLSNSIENDEVFDFLTQKYNEASEFIKRNVSAGTQTHPYSISNSMIILAADPDAIIAAQRSFWEGRNYVIKDAYKHGISVSIPRTTKTQGTAKNILKKPGAFDAYKKERGIDPSQSFSQHVQANPAKHNVDMAHSAIQQKAVRTGFGEFGWGNVYTDNMVEPMPGKEVESIQDMIGTNVDAQDAFNIPQKELDSAAHIEKLNTLFGALIDIAEEKRTNTAGLKFDRNSINDFNKLLNAVAFEETERRLPSKMGLNANKITPEVKEMLHGYSEAVSNVVKKHYGLPSDESVYNVARQGIDREEIEKVYGEIIRISHDIIKKLDSTISSETKALNEVRKIVRTVIRKNL